MHHGALYVLHKGFVQDEYKEAQQTRQRDEKNFAEEHEKRGLEDRNGDIFLDKGAWDGDESMHVVGANHTEGLFKLKFCPK